MTKRRLIRYSVVASVLAALSMQSACSDDGDTGVGNEGGADNGGTSLKAGSGGGSRAGSSTVQTGGRIGTGGNVNAVGGNTSSGGKGLTGGTPGTGGVAGSGGTTTAAAGASNGGTAVVTGGASNGGTAVVTGGASNGGVAGQIVSRDGGVAGSSGNPYVGGASPSAGNAGVAGGPDVAGKAGVAGVAGQGGSAGTAGQGGDAGAAGGSVAGAAGTSPQSCREILSANALSADGVYRIDPDLSGTIPALEVYCDMTTNGGGWTLVYRATNRAGTIENGLVTSPGAIGTTPFDVNSTGQFKLTDDAINALRSAAVANDLRVIVRRPGFTTLVGTSFHPKECGLQSGTILAAADTCNKSTTTGPNDTANYIQSGHAGSLTRWYVDATLGYIWPGQHIGPIPDGSDHMGNLPPTYCTWIDARTCPEDSAFEIWAY